MELLHHWFSFVCGQNNCWYLAGQSLPMCQRCTGLYAGAACAVVCWLLFGPNPTSRVLWAHGMFLLAMVPFGYHFVRQNGDIRTVTGWLFAFGLVYYMAAYIRASHSGTARKTDVASKPGIYFSCVGAGGVGLLLSVHAGRAWTAHVLSALAVAGFLALAALTLTTVAELARNAVRHLSRA